MKIQVSVPTSVKITVMSEFLERIAYLSDQIQSVTYHEPERSVEIQVAEGSDVDLLLEAYEKLANSSSKWRIPQEREVKSNVTVLDPDDVCDSDAQESPFYDEMELQVLDWLDKQFVAIAKRFGATIRQYPSMLEAATMEKCKYHTNFPQNIYSIFEIPHDYQIIDQIRQDRQGLQPHHLTGSGRFLQPCICYHCYEEWAAKQFHTNQVLTAKGTCFRHEIVWRLNPLRKLEFTMREIVFIGQEKWVMQTREQLLEEVWSLFVNLGLVGKIVSAKDPFFFYDDMKKATFQLMSNAKYELVAVTKGKSSSIASFNYCNTVLCEGFQITDPEGEHLHSGCVAFGIDRWMQVFLTKYGKKQVDWPVFMGSE